MLLFDLSAEGLEVGIDSTKDFENLRAGFSGDLGADRKLLHRGDDDADEEVQNRKGGDHNEGDEEDPSERVGLHDGADDAHGPAFESHHLEEGVEAGTEGAEPLGME